MIIKMVDVKLNEKINVKIELSDKMFIVVPVIKDQKFNYLQYKLLDIRKKYMKIFIDNSKYYKDIEQKIYNEMKDLLLNETKRINNVEGIRYYIV